MKGKAKKKAVKKAKPTKVWFVQDWGTYSPQTLVVVGYTEPEILELMKKIKTAKETVAEFERGMERDKNFVAHVCGFAWYSDETGASVLSLASFKDEWQAYETLMHEVVHLVLLVLIKHRRFVDFYGGKNQLEQEGLAYQIEYMFRGIRKRLQKEFGYV